MKKKLPIIGSILAGLMSYSASIQADTLHDVLNKALKENPLILSQLHQLQATEAYEGVARSGFMPTIDVYGNISIIKTHNANSSNKTPTNTDANIELKQNIFSGFKTTHEIKSAEYDSEVKYASLQTHVQKISIQIIDVYLQVLEYNQLLELSKKNVEIHTQMFQKISQRAQQGVARTSDLSQIEARMARSNANLINIKNALLEAKKKFQGLTGFMPNNLKIPNIMKLPKLPNSYEDALKNALDNHPEITSDKYSIKQSQSTYDANKSNFYPNIDISLKQSWEKTPTTTPSQKDTTVQLSMHYNIFNGKADASKRSELAHITENKRANLQSTLRTVKENLQIAWNTYGFRQQERKFLMQHKTASIETTEAYREQFNLGKRTLIDLLNSENELFESRKNLTSSTYKNIFAHYKILDSTGQLIDILNLDLPEEW